MQYLQADVKSMPESFRSHKYILVICCEITRYVICIPMTRIDAPALAEAILQRCVLIFGPPKRLDFDEDRALGGKVMQFMLEALKIDVKFISPHNHGSLVAERHIRTVSEFLTSCLGGNGRNWDLYCQCVAYSYNTFTLPTMGYSPFQMVYLRDPPDLKNLTFNPIQTIARDHREYVELVKERLQYVSKAVLDLQASNQNRQAARQRDRISKKSPWCEGLLVFLLAPTAAALQTNSKKIRMDYVGPLVITTMLDPTHAVLSDLGGRQIYGVFHVNRMKVAWVRTGRG